MRLRDAVDAISEAFVLWDLRETGWFCAQFEIPRVSRARPCPKAAPGAPPMRWVMKREAVTADRRAEPAPQCRDAGRTVSAQLRGLARGSGRWLQINERRTGDGGYVSVGSGHYRAQAPGGAACSIPSGRLKATSQR